MAPSPTQANVTRQEAMLALSRFGFSSYEIKRGCLIYYVFLIDTHLRGPVTLKSIQERICHLFGKYTKASNGIRGNIAVLNNHFVELVKQGKAEWTGCTMPGCTITKAHRICAVKTDCCKGRELARCISLVMRGKIIHSLPFADNDQDQLKVYDKVQSEVEDALPLVVPHMPVVQVKVEPSAHSSSSDIESIFNDLFSDVASLTPLADEVMEMYHSLEDSLMT